MRATRIHRKFAVLSRSNVPAVVFRRRNVATNGGMHPGCVRIESWVYVFELSLTGVTWSGMTCS